MNESVLFLSFQFTNLPIKKYIKRIIVSGIVETVIMALVLLMTSNYKLFILLGNFIVIPLLCVFIVKDIRFILITIVCSVLAGGVGNAINNYFHTNGYFFTIAICWGVIVWLKGYTRSEKGKFLVQIKNGEKCYQGMALYDTGNTLKSADKKEVIHIADSSVIKELEVDKIWDIVGYKALGTELGMLKVYRVDSMKVWKKNKEILLINPLIGEADSGIIDKANYQIILNEGVFYEND